MKGKYVIALIFCCLMVMGAGNAKFEGTLRVALMTDILNTYPWDNRRQESVFVLDNVYEPLIRFKEGNTDFEYCLATSVNPSPDFVIWTVHLRKDVHFHDGSPMNADAVIASLTMLPLLRDKVQKVDEYTVTITFNEPSVVFPNKLMLLDYSIASLATVKCYKEKCKMPAFYGTGPFKLNHWTPGKEIVLEANENYWGKRPTLKEAVFIPFGREADLVKALKTNQVDIALAVSPNSISVIREIPHITFRTLPTLGLGILALNTEKLPLSNSKVRKAIGYAINKKELVKKYFFGGRTGAAAQTFAPPQIMKLFDSSLDIDYNPEKAKALLKEAGYANGIKITLVPIFVQRPYMPDPPRIAEDIVNFLAAVGIKVNVINVKTDVDFRRIRQNASYDMILFGWMADVIDPDEFLTSLLGSESINDSNLSRWSNKQFDNYLIEARKQKNSMKRLEFYQKSQVLFHQELPFVPLFVPLQPMAWSDKVIGFIPHPISRFYLQNISLSK